MTDLEQIDEKIVDGRFKDSAPLATVAKIKSILHAHGLETEEIWNDTCVPYCHSMSVKLLGTCFRVNGKGLTKEFTLASGYGELMERLQMGFITGPNVLKDGDFSIDDGRYEMMPAADLLAQNRPWYEQMAQRLRRYTGVAMSPEQILAQYADGSGRVAVTPFYDLNTGTTEHLPTILRKRVYATNGCAAGNSPEEAIVQAISEMVERNHQLYIIDQCLTLPDIPETVLEQCPVAWKIIRFVRANGYKVVLKDASLGTGFPVVCACIIDRQTGRYHTHFGAYPIFEIALERSLTESFQGRNIRNIATFENFSQKKSGDFSLNDLSNELTMGTWEKRPEFFVGQPHQPFDPDQGFPGGDNRELLDQCVAYFHRLGYHVLARDRSCLGFPTYQVVIPGYSEAHINRLSIKMDDHRYAPYAIKALRSPTTASLEDMLGLLMHLEQTKSFSANIRGVHGFLMSAKLSATLSPAEENHYMSAALAYVYYALGRHSELPRCIDGLLLNAKEDDVEYLICMKRYFHILSSEHDEAKARRTVEFFHTPATLQRLYRCLDGQQNPFQDLVLECDRKCDERCKLYATCCQRRVDELTQLLNEQYKKLRPEAFAQALGDVRR